MINEEHNYLRYKSLEKQNYQKRFSHYITPDKQDFNPVYQFMKTQKIISTLLGSLFVQKKPRSRFKTLTQSNNFRTLTQMESYDSSRKLSQKQSQKRQTRSRLLNLSAELNNFQANVDKSKKRLNILSRYNRISRELEEKIPSNPGQQTRQDLEETQRILTICKEYSLPKKTSSDMVQEAQKLIKYTEPSIDKRHQEEFRRFRKKREKKLKTIKAKRFPTAFN